MKEQDLFNNAEYLLSLALKKTNNFEHAEDLVSETLISALVSLRDGKSIDNLKAYLSVILNQLCQKNTILVGLVVLMVLINL